MNTLLPSKNQREKVETTAISECRSLKAKKINFDYKIILDFAPMAYDIDYCDKEVISGVSGQN